jgi:cation diffusion facilitator family transporter
MTKKLSYIEGWLSTVINVVLFSFKLFVGIFSGSIAITADAWHTLSDSMSSLVVIIGAKMASKPKDKDHPFGHGRIELIASLIIGFLLLITAFNITVESIDRLSHHQMFTFHPLVIIACIVSIVLKEGMAQFSFWAYRKTKSTALKADAWHHRSDAISSVLILAGIFLGKYFWWIDSVLGIIVAVLIGITAMSIIKDAVNPLIGERLDNKTKKQIEEIVHDVLKTDLKPHHFHYHKYGNHRELSFHIYLDGNLKIKEGHTIADTIEKKIMEVSGIDATIHIDSFIQG